MAQTYDRIDEQLAGWIARQPMFFVGTAPLAGDGHVNVSPKGPGGSLRVVDPETVAYLDATGSGIETVAHLRENGRIVAVTRVASSCGYAVPLMSYEADRDHLRLSAAKWLRSDGPEAFDDYRGEHNAASIDGLPALG